MSAARNSPASFLKHASDVATYYGFHSVRELERATPDAPRIRATHSFATATSAAAGYVASHPNEPGLAFYATPTPSFAPLHLHERETGEFGLLVVGTTESVGEVVLLKTMAAIMGEWGAPLARVRVNALGDKESQSRFAREFSLFTRKQQASLDPACREHLGERPFALFACGHEACRAVIAEGPRAMNYLSEKSRLHFKSVLEHLENLGLPYELDDLLGGDERDPHISFAIDLETPDGTVVSAQGGRYDEYLKRHTGRKDSVGVAGSLYFRKKGASRASFAPKLPSRAPKIYFVQLGTRAKLQGLMVLDLLRHAQIPVSQSFDASKLTPQLSAAKTLGVSHMLIMGQREALDGTIIVRSTQNSSQVIVALGQLPRFLKTLR